LLFGAALFHFNALIGCRTPGGATTTSAGAWRAAPWPLPETVRGVWVARFHYRYPGDIATIMENCAKIGCNTVFWQVRGEGTVAYPSRIEPWSREYDYRDPGFDPLAIAVEQAHRHGLRIEAYINVMPGWKGKVPPPISEQLYNTHPDWFLHDDAGRRQPLGDFYVILNPCLPEVRRHIVSVIGEIVARYDVDGVHLDYVRYAWDESPNAKQNYPRDLRTVSLYRRDVGKAPDDDPASWNNWRANQLTRLVSEIRAVINRRRSGATLTAAVWRDPRRGYNEYLQNSIAWLRTGLVDAVMPMAYSKKLGQLEADIDSYQRLAVGYRVVPGLGIYLHEKPEQIRAQLRRCQAWGGDFALFSYDSLFPTAGDRRKKPEDRAAAQRLRHLRRGVLAEEVPPS
ncbi:MAG: family 10 glycosylhydrolase, partial [Phycisphaerae bacterium]|nr:family 10 glycosylhydrolase [Phycisphaerae bacterium]